MPTTMLDPFALLSVVAQPMLAARDACVRLLSGTTSKTESRGPKAPRFDSLLDADAEDDASTQIEREASVTERSFANELGALLGRPAVQPEADPTAPRRDATSPSRLPEPANSEPIEIPAASKREPVALAEECATFDDPLPAKPEANAHRIVSRSTAPLMERSVPITRLPLRPQENAITWTRDVDDVDFEDRASRARRHALLERSAREAGTLSGAILERAYREEDIAGRTLALRALSLHHPAEKSDLFIEALRIGSDDERALAIDGLTSLGARAELVPAFDDRVDAVAAKAALAYVGSRSRNEYRAELAAHIDAAQIERILSLLAGIIE